MIVRKRGDLRAVSLLAPRVPRGNDAFAAADKGGRQSSVKRKKNTFEMWSAPVHFPHL